MSLLATVAPHAIDVIKPFLEKGHKADDNEMMWIIIAMIAEGNNGHDKMADSMSKLTECVRNLHAEMIKKGVV